MVNRICEFVLIRIREFDVDLDDDLLVKSRIQLPSVIPQPFELDEFSDELPTRPTRSITFCSTQERILKSLTSQKRSPSNLEDISPIMRGFLAVISLIPYAIKAPFSSHVPGTPQYRLNLDQFALWFTKDLGNPWTDRLIGEIEFWLPKSEDEEFVSIGKLVDAIYSSESKPPLLNIPLSGVTIDASTAGTFRAQYANIRAVRAALSSLEHTMETIFHSITR